MLFELFETPFPGSYLHTPLNKEVKAAIVVLHGSEGGGAFGHCAMARFLAEYGYAALAFTWCASKKHPVPDVQPDIIDINLENTCEAIRWLQQQPLTKGKKTGLYGVSRGAEQALILASMQTQPTLPRIDALAVHASPSRVMPGWSDVRPFDYATARAWCSQGQPLEPGQPIQIENFPGSVFLSHGINDFAYGEYWEVGRSRELEERLRQRKDGVVEAHYLPDEGHILSDEGMLLHQEHLLYFFNRHLL